MIQILLLLALVVFVGLAVQRLRQGSTTGGKRSDQRRRWLLGGVLLLALGLAATGRLGLLIPLFGALIAALLRLLPILLPMLLQTLPLWKRWQQQQRATRQTAGASASESSVESRHLRMRLNHADGTISGEIRAGKYAGRRLQELSQTQLRELYADYLRIDEESATLLRAYLERVYGESEQAGADSDTGAGNMATNGKMTRHEAYEVLGLEPGASREDVIAAHRRLMQKLHPDRGGSDYLAAKINAAKKVLLGG